LIVEPGEARSVEEWLAEIERAMTETQDRLAEEAIRRDPAAFDVLLAGRAGVGGVYDLWRRAKAFVSGQPFRPEHGDTTLSQRGRP
jgi:hypothetical protein